MDRYSKAPSSVRQSFDELTPDLKQWVREKAHQYGVSEQQIIVGCCQYHGSVEQGRIDDAIADIETKKDDERWKEYSKKNPLPTPTMLGAKPSANEKVIVVPLTNNISIRVWGDKLACHNLFSFDFVDGAGRYIRTPPGIKIYTVGVGLVPGGVEVHSIEKSVALSDVGGSFRRCVDKSMPPDPDWETYLIPEGIRLRITHTGRADSFLDIPSRQPRGHVLQIQPYW